MFAGSEESIDHFLGNLYKEKLAWAVLVWNTGWRTTRAACYSNIDLHLRNSPLTKVFNVETRDRIEPERLWFRLVVSDHYLSLMLGLPQDPLVNSFAIPK